MGKYATKDGDRIGVVIDWNGQGTPASVGKGVDLFKLPDDIDGAAWVGKSYLEASTQGGSPKKDAKEGVRASEPNSESFARPSGEALNTNMGDNTTMAMEHPLDPVLGSEMRTPTPQLNVAFVPSTQPKTADQVSKDAGEKPEFKNGKGNIGRHQPHEDQDNKSTPAKRAQDAGEASDTMDIRKAKAGQKVTADEKVAKNAKKGLMKKPNR